MASRFRRAARSRKPAPASARKPKPRAGGPAAVRGGRGQSRLIAALRESEARFRELTELSADWYWEQDAELRFVSTAGRSEQRGGIEPQEHLGRLRWELPGTEIISQTWEEHRALLAARRPFRNLRLRRVAADGTVHHLAVSGVPVFGRDGAFAGYRGVTADITERVLAEEALRANRRLLEQVIDAIPMSIFAKDLDSNYVMANRYMAEFFGTTKEGLLQRHTSQLPTLDATRQQSLRDDRWVFEHRRTHVHETWIQRPDGTPVPFHSSKIPLFDEAGRLTGLLGINRDITEERSVHRRLEVSAQLFRAMFDDSPAPLAVIDPDTRCFLEVNRAFTGLFGFTQPQVAGRTSSQFGGSREGDERPALYARLLEDGFVQRMPLTSYTASGERNLSLVSARIIEVDARRVALFGFADITELSRAQRQVEEANASLEDRVRERTSALALALKAMESFSYTISHDLRAPLRTISRYSQLLRTDAGAPLGEEQRRRLDRIEGAGAHMAQLIDAILELAHVGKLELRRRELDMNALVRRIAGQLGESSPWHPELEIGELPDAAGDETLISQVWLNLIGNAYKYSARAEAPRVVVGGAAEPGRNVYFVRDNGTGFDPAYADKLFGLFQRLHMPTEYPGTGLGLAIVREAVARHGGGVWAEGRPGKGATFYFSLPRPAPAAAA